MVLKKKFRIQILIALLAASIASAQTTVEFYSTVSSSEDTDMISMTTNLFFTQLQGLDGYSVSDRRDKEFSGAGDFISDLAFFAEIQEDSDGWICTLNVIDRKTKRIVTETKSYASYYKILLDAKSSLENVLENMDRQVSDQKKDSDGDSSQDINLDTLAGTWTGDTLIDKIVILRGGKGFVIFKNGASMNITVAIRGTSVVITQKGRSNASFFPELNREVALKNVATASPIKWEFNITDSQTLKGIKTTLVEDKKSSTGASPKEIEVEWEKVVQ